MAVKSKATAGRRKHVPLRICIACQQQRPKRELVRIVRSPEGVVDIDRTGKQSGRGAYVCLDADCWHMALEPRKLGRVLRCDVTAADTARLLQALEGMDRSG